MPSQNRKSNYAVTINNYPPDWEDRLNRIFNFGEIRYMIFGVEVAPTTGTPHLQGHIDLREGRNMKWVQKHLFGFYFEKYKPALKTYKSRRHVRNGRAYPQKDGQFKEWGTPPDGQGKRSDLKVYLEDLKENPEYTRLELFEQHAGIMAKYPRFAAEYQNLCREYKTLDWTVPPNLWVHGAPGTGKTRRFHEDEHTLYLKQPNKWWDYYNGEHTVLIDDLGPEQARHLGYYLKIWCDRFPFLAQVKGSAYKARPKRIVVTSNYCIDAMGWDEVTTQAIKRRFQEVEVI